MTRCKLCGEKKPSEGFMTRAGKPSDYCGPCRYKLATGKAKAPPGGGQRVGKVMRKSDIVTSRNRLGDR